MKTIAALLLPFLILLMIESCSRTLITLREDLNPPPVAVDPMIAERAASREIGWEGYRVRPEQIPEPKLPRIVAIGDSNTWGYGVGLEAAWPTVLGRSLRDAEVVNMATSGYSSFQGLQTLRKYGDRLKPSMIIASFNFNDRAFVYNHHGDSEEKFAKFFDAQGKSDLYNWLNKIYTTRILRAIMSRVGLLRTEPLKKIDVRELDPRVPPDKYRENLRKIVEYGRERNIPVLFILLKDNPYYVSQIRAGLASRERGDFAHAVRAFTIGQTNAISGSMSRKFLAETYALMGQNAKAEEAGRMEPQRESVGGFFPIVPDYVYNNVMIEVGREMGVEVVDARPMLDANPEMFIDMCHPDEIGQSRLARLVFDGIKSVAPELAKDAKPIEDLGRKRESKSEPRMAPVPAVNAR